jgi:hypothetical protein
MEALILVATLGGPTMFARIGVMRALNRNVERMAIYFGQYPPVRAWQSSQISRPRLTFRKQLVGRFVQTLLLRARIRQMTN